MKFLLHNSENVKKCWNLVPESSNAFQFFWMRMMNKYCSRVRMNDSLNETNELRLFFCQSAIFVFVVNWRFTGERYSETGAMRSAVASQAVSNEYLKRIFLVKDLVWIQNKNSFSKIVDSTSARNYFKFLTFSTVSAAFNSEIFRCDLVCLCH